MNSSTELLFPELVIGLVGPIGVDMDSVILCLQEQLRLVEYGSKIIHIADIMTALEADVEIDKSSYAARYRTLIIPVIWRLRGGTS